MTGVRKWIRERQRQGIALARTKRTYRGRTSALTPEQVATARYQLTQKISKAQIARDLGAHSTMRWVSTVHTPWTPNRVSH